MKMKMNESKRKSRQVMYKSKLQNALKVYPAPLEHPSQSCQAAEAELENMKRRRTSAKAEKASWAQAVVACGYSELSLSHLKLLSEAVFQALENIVCCGWNAGFGKASG